MGDPPSEPFIGLDVALSWLAHGETSPVAYVPPDGAAHSFLKLTTAIRQCIDEARSGSQYKDFPTNLRAYPLSQLINDLGRTKDSWPPSAGKLYELAEEIARRNALDRRRFYDYREVWASVRMAAQDGSVSLYGRNENSQTSEYQPIPTPYFLSNAFPDSTLRHIAIRTRQLSTWSNPGKETNAWYDVRARTQEIQSLLDGFEKLGPLESMSSLPQPKGTVDAETECKAWLENLMANDSRPTKLKTKYFDAAYEKFAVGRRGFDRAWANAMIETGNFRWKKPGPKS